MDIDITELNPVVTAAQVVEALKDVYDPELGVDLINLGLVYALAVVGSDVTVTMTLTTPGCPMHGSIEKEVLMTLERLPGVGWVDVQVVWDPPWSLERISDVGRRLLYWL